MNAAEPTKPAAPSSPPKVEPRTVPPSIVAGGKLPESIAASVIIFDKAIQIPGDLCCQNVKADKDARGQRWTLTLISRLNLFEIMFHPQDQKLPVQVGYVPMTFVQSWRPA